MTLVEDALLLAYNCGLKTSTYRCII